MGNSQREVALAILRGERRSSYVSDTDGNSQLSSLSYVEVTFADSNMVVRYESPDKAGRICMGHYPLGDLGSDIKKRGFPSRVAVQERYFNTGPCFEGAAWLMEIEDGGCLMIDYEARPDEVREALRQMQSQA